MAKELCARLCLARVELLMVSCVFLFIFRQGGVTAEVFQVFNHFQKFNFTLYRFHSEFLYCLTHKKTQFVFLLNKPNFRIEIPLNKL